MLDKKRFPQLINKSNQIKSESKSIFLFETQAYNGVLKVFGKQSIIYILLIDIRQSMSLKIHLVLYEGKRILIIS